MHKLGITDASFLYLERDGAPMNIASLQRFSHTDPDVDMGTYFRRLKRYLASRVQGVPFMTRRLKWTPLGLDQPVWTSDPDFNLNNHVRRARLPSPGSQRQLEKLVATLHEKPLDRKRPLWEMVLIEGLEEGGFALYSKYHHCAIDGRAGQQILAVLYGEAPDRNPRPAPRTATELTDNAQLVFDALLNLAFQPLDALTRVGERLRALARVAERFSDGEAGAALTRAPQTILNVPVSAYRSFATTSLPLAEMRAVGRQSGASINDVLLSVCADGLRRYLSRRSALPEAPLLAGIPVSLRKAGDRSFNNSVGLLRASLATDLADPRERLAEISRSTRAGKQLLHDARALLPEDLHLPGLGPLMQNVSRLSGRLTGSETVEPLCNVLISNVPGPRRRKYLLGAEMLTHHPVSIAADNNALNITVQSYQGRLDLGITACLEVVPDIEQLRDDLLAGWSVLSGMKQSTVVAIAA